MMKAMILAAGRGKRMGVLTDNCPKPLLRVGDDSLIGWQLRRLARAGFRDVVINLGYKGEMIEAELGDGDAYGVRIVYSREPESGLETAGGLIQALPLLDDAPFLVVNADVWCDVDLRRFSENRPADSLAHLLLVDTPAWKASGDFSLAGTILIAGSTLTFSGISVIHPRLFSGVAAGFRPLAPILHQYLARGALSGEQYNGVWQDVGTAERLAVLQVAYR
ncbi:MAG: nucleotidyltransferase family protein [Cardiobacteriaceae bacterium]|nr:nucleotidyltransferase family protein [Cardiobacteriaceae bacterium]